MKLRYVSVNRTELSEIADDMIEGRKEKATARLVEMLARNSEIVYQGADYPLRALMKRYPRCNVQINIVAMALPGDVVGTITVRNNHTLEVEAIRHTTRNSVEEAIGEILGFSEVL